MGGVGPLVVVEGDPASDARLGLRPGFPSVQVNTFILQRPPETLDKDVVQVSGFAIHGDFGLGSLQPVGPVEGRELTTLIRVHDLRRPKFVDRLVQCLKAEVGLQRVREAPGQNFPRDPIHDGHQVKEPGPQ